MLSGEHGQWPSVISGTVPLLSLAILVVGKGGKMEAADHLSKAILFFYCLFVFKGDNLVRVTRHPSFFWGATVGLLILLSGWVHGAIVSGWPSITGYYSIVLWAAVASSIWSDSRRNWALSFFSAVSVLQVVFLVWGRWGREAFIFFPGNPQYVSFLFCVMFLVAVGRIGGAWRSLWMIVAFTSLVGVFLVPVRSGAVGVVTGLAVLLRKRYGPRSLAWLVAGLVVVFILLPVSVLEKIAKVHDPLAYKRTDIWLASISSVRERPFLGWGPGRFENAYWIHERPQNDLPVRYEMSTDRAHNDWLQMAVEAGLPGVLLCGLAFMSLWKTGPSAQELTPAWSGAGVFLMFNSPLVLPACGALTGILFGLSPGSRPEVPPNARLLRWARVLLMLIVIPMGSVELILLWNTQRKDRGNPFFESFVPIRLEARLDSADQLLHGGQERVGEVEKMLEGFLRWNPHQARIWRDMGHLVLEHQRPPDLVRADSCYGMALKLRPHQAPWWHEWGWVKLKRGDQRGALDAFNRAQILEPNFFEAKADMGLLFALIGDKAKARLCAEHLNDGVKEWPRPLATDSGYRKTVLLVHEAKWKALMEAVR